MAWIFFKEGLGVYSNARLQAPSRRAGEYLSASGSTFANNKPITRVELADSATKIGFDAFRCCNNLTEPILPETMTEIGKLFSSFANGAVSKQKFYSIPVKNHAKKVPGTCKSRKFPELFTGLILGRICFETAPFGTVKSYAQIRLQALAE